MKKPAVCVSDFSRPPFSVCTAGFRIGAPAILLYIVCDAEKVLRAIRSAPKAYNAVWLAAAEPHFVV